MVSVPTISARRDGWMLSMITIGVGCNAVWAISKPTLISMISTPSRVRTNRNQSLFANRNHVDADLHAEECIGRAQISAVQRYRLARIARHGDADQIAAADD